MGKGREETGVRRGEGKRRKVRKHDEKEEWGGRTEKRRGRGKEREIGR